MTPFNIQVRTVGERSVSKVKPILYMFGKGGISVLQTSIFGDGLFVICMYCDRAVLGRIALNHVNSNTNTQLWQG